MIVARFGEKPRDYWIKRLLAADVPAGPVNTIDEVIKDGYVEEAGMLACLSHPGCGKVRMAGIPIRMSATPGALRLPPPMLGQHNDSVLEPTRKPRARSSPVSQPVKRK